MIRIYMQVLGTFERVTVAVFSHKVKLSDFGRCFMEIDEVAILYLSRISTSLSTYL